MISINRKISKKIKFIGVLSAIAFIVTAWKIPVRASDSPDELLNYSFAVWVGSGLYKVDGADKQFAVLRVPLSYTFRRAQYDKEKFFDRLGFKLLLPVVLGAQEETSTNFTFGAGAFVPGLEVQIPVNEYWTLKPFGQFGAGKDTAGGNVKYIYGAGARSLIRFPWKKFKLGIGNSLISAEDRNTKKDETSGFSMAEAGLDVTHPIGLRFGDQELEAGVFFVYSHLFNRADFQEDEGDSKRLRRLYNVGLTLGTAESVSIWKFKLNRVGMNYRWGNAGFRGIGFNLGFPF